VIGTILMPAFDFPILGAPMVQLPSKGTAMLAYN
jgi:hypothetical protein